MFYRIHLGRVESPDPPRQNHSTRNTLCFEVFLFIKQQQASNGRTWLQPTKAWSVKEGNHDTGKASNGHACFLTHLFLPVKPATATGAQVLLSKRRCVHAGQFHCLLFCRTLDMHVVTVIFVYQLIAYYQLCRIRMRVQCT